MRLENLHSFCITSLIAAVLFGSAVLLPLGKPVVADSGGCTVDREEQSVLTTVLQSMTAQPGALLVVETRTDSSHFARTFSLSELLSREGTSDLSSQIEAFPSGSVVFLPNPPPIVPSNEEQELETDFGAKLRKPCTIPTIKNISRQIVFRTPTQLHKIISSPEPIQGWARFHRMFGKDAETVSFSRVAFDKAKDHALVHVSGGISVDGGGGEVYLLSRQNGKWSVTRTFPTWST